MARQEGSAPVAATREACWERLRDLNRGGEYVPGVKQCALTTEQREGVGASRSVVAQAGPLDETVVAWRDGEGFTLRLHRGTRGFPPFADARFTYRLEDDGAGCRIHTAMDYTVALGPLGALLDALVLGRIIAGNVQAVADAFAAWCEADAPAAADSAGA